MKEQGAESQNGSSGLLAEIGGRRRAEEALRASEQRLQDILDNTTAVIFVKDLELRYILVNREYERRFRVKRDEIYGKSDFDIHPRDVAETLRANDRDVIKTGTPMQFEEAVLMAEDERHCNRGEVSAAGPLDGALRGLRYRHGHHGVEQDLQASRARQAALRADIHAAFSSGPENALQTMLQLSVEEPWCATSTAPSPASGRSTSDETC